MSVWHADYDTVREVHNTRRETTDERNPSMQVLLYVPADVVAAFILDLLVDLPGVLSTSNVLMFPIRIDSVHPAGRYTTDADQSIIIPEDHQLVTITYGVDNRQSVNIFNQQVLVSEKLTPSTEYLTQDYTQFAWESTPTVCLTSSDMCPGKIFRSFKIDMTIERIVADRVPTGTGEGGLSCLEVLKLISSTSNDDSHNELSFWTLPGFTFGPEEIMAMVEGVERGITIWDGAEYDQWWTVRIAFSVRPEGWNKFYRYVKSGSQDDSKWESIVHVKTSGNASQPVIKPYPPEPYISYFLDKEA